MKLLLTFRQLHAVRCAPQDDTHLRSYRMLFRSFITEVHVNAAAHSESGLTKLRVENLHYDLTEDDLDVGNP
jgi:hypothetical protein